jgi:Domain of unknown function (DUF4114)
MADIKLGQSIAGSIATTDPKLSDPGTVFNGLNYDEYNVSGLETFRQVNFSLDRPFSTTGFAGLIRVVNTATGAVLAESVTNVGEVPQINGTSFPGINYKVQVFGANQGSYTLSLNDKGKASSIVSPLVPSDIGIAKTQVGTVGASGVLSPLASSDARKLDGGILFDIALAPNNQFYGIGRKAGSGDILYRIDPSVATLNQVSEVGALKNPQGGIINDSLNALEFTPDNKLYAIGPQSNKLYQIDVNTSVATSVGNLPVGLASSGDFVYDAANRRFLATSLDNPSSDSLWQIPLANPAAASKINTIGFANVYGLDFENGELTGFTAANSTNPFGARIKIDPATASGTLDRALGGAGLLGGVSGAATIPGVSTITPVPTSVVGAIGTKNQSLTNRTIDLTDNRNQTLKVDVTTKGDAAYNNNIGFYVVQDSSGSIVVNGQTIKPGDATYAIEAVKSAILRASKNDSQPNKDILGGSIYAPVVIAQGSLTDFISKNPTNVGDGNQIHAYFNYLGANPDKFDHFRLTGPNTFAVEDQYGGGDRDFNDLIVNMNVRTA